MFLVVIEYIEDEGKEWSVVSHGDAGLRSIFPTREAAEKVAVDLAEEGPGNNRVSVVEIKSWFQREVQRTMVKETRIA